MPCPKSCEGCIVLHQLPVGVHPALPSKDRVPGLTTATVPSTATATATATTATPREQQQLQQEPQQQQQQQQEEQAPVTGQAATRTTTATTTTTTTTMTATTTTTMSMHIWTCISRRMHFCIRQGRCISEYAFSGTCNLKYYNPPFTLNLRRVGDTESA